MGGGCPGCIKTSIIHNLLFPNFYFKISRNFIFVRVGAAISADGSWREQLYSLFSGVCVSQCVTCKFVRCKRNSCKRESVNGVMRDWLA